MYIADCFNERVCAALDQSSLRVNLLTWGWGIWIWHTAYGYCEAQ